MANKQQESLEDTIKRVMGEFMGEREKAADRERKRKEAPWDALSDLIDERISEARKRDVEAEEAEDKGSRSKSKSDDSDDQGGGGLLSLLGGR